MKPVRPYFKMGNVISMWFKTFCSVLPTPAFCMPMTVPYVSTHVWPSPRDMGLQFYSLHQLPPLLFSPWAVLHHWPLQPLHPLLPIPKGWAVPGRICSWKGWFVCWTREGKTSKLLQQGGACWSEVRGCPQQEVLEALFRGGVAEGPKGPATLEGVPENAPCWGDRCVSTSTFGGDISLRGVLRSPLFWH